MRKLLLTIITVISFLNILNSQYLIDYELLQSYNETDVTNYLTNEGIPVIFVSITNGMDIYKIKYNTVSYDSSSTIASGTVFIPNNVNCKVPILNYNHGTVLHRTGATSNQTGEYVIGIALGADGFIISMPDYLGLGESPGFHPYHHAQSEATCSIDMLRATRELLDSLGGTEYNDEIFITGYSQGGHVAMATLKFIEENNLLSEFNVGGSAPLSGAYDMAGVQAEVITKDSSYGAPGYLPFIIFSFNMVYNLYPSYSDIFISPYDTLLPNLMTGDYSIGYVENYLPDTPNVILRPELLDSFETNPNFHFRQVLKENSLYNWAPQTPVKMIYCETDELVSYRNALVTKDSMQVLGAPNISTLSANTQAGHQDCALYALLQAKSYFEQLRKDRFDLTVITTQNSSPTSNDGSLLIDINQGYPPFTFQWSNSQTSNPATSLPPGNYSVIVTDANGCTNTISGNIGVTSTSEMDLSDLITVYPNPTEDYLLINLESLTDITIISVLDITGRKIISDLINDNSSHLYSLPVGNLENGTYQVILENKGNSYIKKFTKQ